MLPNGRYVAFVKIPLSCFSLGNFLQPSMRYSVKKKKKGKKIPESKLNTFNG